MGADPKSRRKRWETVCKKTKDCPHCPPNRGENAKKQPRSDRHKSKRKGR
jgi:hypothetical protein